MKKKEYVIIGGGFSGCALAWSLLKNTDSRITLYSGSQKKLGGHLQSIQTEQGLVEKAANALMNDSLVEELFSDLKITMVSKSKWASKKWFYLESQFRRWPLSLAATIRFFYGYFFLIKILNNIPQKNQSVSEYAESIFGKTSKILFQSALQGVYGAQVEDLSAYNCLSSLRGGIEIINKPERELQYHASVAPLGGMGQLGTAFEKYFEQSPRIKIINEDFKSEIRPRENKIYVLSTDAQSASSLLSLIIPKGESGKSDSINKINLLKKISYRALYSVTLFPKKRSSKRGFGCLFPENKTFLGVLWNKDIFQRPGLNSETWVISGKIKKEENKLLDELESFRNKTYQITEELQSVPHFITYWPKAIPSFDLNHESALSALLKADKHPELGFVSLIESQVYAFGNYTGAIGLNKILTRAWNISHTKF